MTDRIKLAEGLGSGHPRGCPSHPSLGCPCCVPCHLLRGPDRPCRCPRLYCGPGCPSCRRRAGHLNTTQSADPSKPREPCGGRAKTTCLNSLRLNGMYSSLFQPISKYHKCVYDHLLQIYPCSITRALLLYRGPFTVYLHPLNGRPKVTLLLFCN
jgi:hypothetical protein